MIEINRNPTRKELLVFAELLALFLAVIGWMVWRRHPQVAAALWTAAPVVAVIGGLVAWFAPRAMRLLYLGWMYAAMPIGWVVSHLILAAVFYLVVTPIGLIMRLVGYDPMHRRFDRSATSYWVEHNPAADARRYFRQF